jgi:hypothetical protein
MGGSNHRSGFAPSPVCLQAGYGVREGPR